MAVFDDTFVAGFHTSLLGAIPCRNKTVDSSSAFDKIGGLMRPMLLCFSALLRPSDGSVAALKDR